MPEERTSFLKNIFALQKQISEESRAEEEWEKQAAALASLKVNATATINDAFHAGLIDDGDRQELLAWVGGATGSSLSSFWGMLMKVKRASKRKTKPTPTPKPKPDTGTNHGM